MLCYQYCFVFFLYYLAAQQIDHGPNNTRVKDDSGLAQLRSYCHIESHCGISTFKAEIDNATEKQLIDDSQVIKY